MLLGQGAEDAGTTAPSAPRSATRRLTPPGALDTEAAKAAYDNGALTLYIAPAAHQGPQNRPLQRRTQTSGLAAVRDLSGKISHGRQKLAGGLLHRGGICRFTGVSPRRTYLRLRFG